MLSGRESTGIAAGLRVTGFVGAALAASVALAQVPDAPPAVRPFAVGKLLAYPLFRADYDSTDNLFRTQTDPTSARTTSILAGLLFEAPFQSSELRFGYAARYRDYADVDIDDNVLHALRVDTDLRFARGAYLELDADYQDGAQDTLLFDPGGEITFRGESFTARTTRLAVGHDVPGLRRIGLRLGGTRIRFDREVLDAASFFDTEDLEAALVGEHRRTPRVTLRWELTGSTARLERPLLTGPDRRDSDSATAAAGIRVELGPGTRLEGLVGWTRRDYESPTSSSLRTVTGSLELVRRTPARGTWVVRLDRAAYPSVYLDNDYYVSTSLFAEVRNSDRLAISVGGRAILSRNAYPESSVERTDESSELGGWIGYRFASGLTWVVTGSWSHRDSTGPFLDYDAYRVGTSLRLGS